MTAVERIAGGLALVRSADTLEVTDVVDAAVREKAYQLGGTLAALLMK